MPLKFAVICASNQNRSMEAHQVLSRRNLQVKSYGTNTLIKIPGPSANQPNTYPFGSETTYESISKDLIAKDQQLYQQNGLLHLLERNNSIKTRPERWKEAVDSNEIFDVIITCEERCFDVVIEEIMTKLMQKEGIEVKKDKKIKIKTESNESRESRDIKDSNELTDIKDRNESKDMTRILKINPVYIVNFEMKDTPEDASIGARVVAQFAMALEENLKELDNQFQNIIDQFIAKGTHSIMYTVMYL